MKREFTFLFKMKKLYFFCISFFLILILSTAKTVSASSVPNDGSLITVLQDDYFSGNSPKNITLSSWIGCDSDFLYYIKDNQYLMKKSLNGNDSPVVLKNISSLYHIIVTKEWIYYISDGNKLIRVHKDGSGEQILDSINKSYIGCMLIIDNYLYCTKDATVCRMELDGTNKKTIANVRADTIQYYDGALYITASDPLSVDQCGVWKYQLNTQEVVKLSNVCMSLPELVNGTFYYNAWDSQMDKYGLFCMTLPDMKPKRVTSDYKYCLGQYKGLLLVSDESSSIYLITKDFTKRKLLGNKLWGQIIGDLYYLNNDIQNPIKLSDNTAKFEDTALTDTADDVIQINNTDYQIQLKGQKNISVGPYNVQMNEDGKSFTLQSAFVNDSKAVCPDSLTLPNVLNVNGQEYQITAIGDGFILESNVKELIVPESILSIGNDFCSNAGNLESVSLPSGLKHIGYLFIGSSYYDTLKEIKIAEGNPYFKMIDGAMYSFDGKTLVRAPFASGIYRVKDGVTTIAAGCFYENNEISKVIIPDSVTSIGAYAFYNCEKNLEEVILPDCIEEIGERAFQSCRKLESFHLPAHLRTINKACFASTSLKEVIIPEGVTEIGEWAYSDCCYIKKLSLGSTLKEISNSAFHIGYLSDTKSSLMPKDITISPKNPYYKIVKGGLLSKDGTIFYSLLASDSTYTVPSKVKTIQKAAFYNNTQAMEIILPEGITNIPEDAFAYSSITKVVLPSTIKTIGKSAFEYTYLYKINLPKGLKVIGEHAFLGTRLNTVTIPSTVIAINEKAFSVHGLNLTMIFKGATPPKILLRQTDEPGKGGSELTVYVPESSINLYKAAFESNHNGVKYTIKASKN